MRIVRKDKRFPVARSHSLLTEQVDSETVIFDEETKQSHCLAPLASVVFAHSDGRTSSAQLAEIASERLGEPVSEEQVQVALAQLEERGLLSSPLSAGISRRAMIHRSAVVGTAAATATLIFTVDPMVAQAAACTSLTCAHDGDCPNTTLNCGTMKCHHCVSPKCTCA